MHQMSLMPAHVPAQSKPARVARDVPLPLVLDVPNAEASAGQQSISPITRDVCSEDTAKANLARYLKRKCLYEATAKKVAKETGADLRTGAAVMEQAQRDKLLSVRPVTRGVCRVQTTESGLEMLKRGGR